MWFFHCQTELCQEQPNPTQSLESRHLLRITTQIDPKGSHGTVGFALFERVGIQDLAIWGRIASSRYQSVLYWNLEVGTIYIVFFLCDGFFRYNKELEREGKQPVHWFFAKPDILCPWAPIWSTLGTHVDQTGAHGLKMSGSGSLEARIQASNKERVYGLVRPNRTRRSSEYNTIALIIY